MTARAVVAVLAGLLGQCAPEPPAAPAWQRLVLSGVGAPAPREPTVLARHDLVDDLDAWEVDAPAWGVAAPPSQEPGGRPMLMIGTGRTDRMMTVRRPVALDPSRVDRIEATALLEEGGGAGFAVEFLRGGSVAAVSEVARIPRRRQASRLVFDVPARLRGAEPFDGLGLRAVGAGRILGLREVVLLDVPVAGRLPAPEDGATLVALRHEARRGVGLVASRPVQATATVPSDDTMLTFSWCWPRRTWVRGAAPVLLVSIDAVERVTTHRLRAGEDPVLADGTGWRTDRLPLDGFGGRQVTIRFTLVAGEAGHGEEARAPGGGTGEGEATAPRRAGPPAAAGGGAPDPRDVGVALAEVALVRPAERPPTVLLVTSDTHRGDHLGAAGDGVDVETPVLDGLARRGVRFADCFAPVNNTNPSHVALMTGTSPRDTGVLSNYRPLGEAAPTLAEAFAAAGFATFAAVSSRHLGPEGSGLGQGFDRVSWPPEGGQREGRAAVDDVLGWLDDATGRPLFVWLHVFDAHTPYEPPPPWRDRYWPGGRDPRDPSLPEPLPDNLLPAELRGIRDLDYPRALYRGEVSGVDEQLGRLLAAPRLADAVVAVVADHGESLGEHGTWFWHIGLYPSTLHVPLLLAGPGVPEGVVCERPVTHLDLGRTLLDLAGLDAVPFPGRDLVEIAGGSGLAGPRFAVEAGGLSASVTHDGLHLVLALAERDMPNVARRNEAHAVELYDLRADPAAEHDLVDERPEDARRLRARLVAWLSAADDRGWAAAGTEDAEMLESLRALGYVAPASSASSSRLWVPDDCAWCRRFE